MKKTKLVFFFIIIGMYTYSESISVLNMQYEIIRKNEKRIEEEQKLKSSKIEVLTIKKEKLNKEIEIINKNRENLLEISKLATNLLIAEKTGTLLMQKKSDYSSKLEIMKQNPEMTNELDKNEVEYMLFYVMNEIEKQTREKEYSQKELLRISSDEKSEVEGYAKKKSELYKTLFDIEEKELTEIILIKRGREEIDRKRMEYETLKLQYEEEERAELATKKRNEIDMENAKGSLEVLKKEIEIKQKRLNILKEKIKRGIAGYEELRTSEINWIELHIKQIELEGQIRYLELVKEK